MPADEELALEIAEVKGQLKGLVDSISRIEGHMQMVAGIDRNMAEVKITQAHTSDALNHIRERMDQNTAASTSAINVVHSRIDSLTKEQTKFESRVMGAWYVTCGLATIVVAVSTWALNEINASVRLNIQQDQRIIVLERQLQQRGEKP